jgi:hypothetical protein
MLNPCLKYVFTLVTTISNSCDIVRRLGTRYITWGLAAGGFRMGVDGLLQALLVVRGGPERFLNRFH